MFFVNVVNLIAYVPFLLAFLICGIIFVLAARKEGFYRSLVSFGASVAAIIVSWLLSKLFCLLLAGPATALFNSITNARASYVSEITSLITRGIINGVLSFVFFGIFFFVSVIVAKRLSKRIKWNKIENDDPTSPRLCLAAIAVRGVDALLVAVMLLVPLYGPISFALPTVAEISGAYTGDYNSETETYDEPDEESQAILKITRHPVLGLYKFGPASMVVKSLSAVNVGGESLNVASILNAVTGLYSRYRTFSSASGEERVEALSDLVQFMRKNIIEKSWSYALLNAFRTYSVDNLQSEEATNDKTAAVLQAFFDKSLKMNRKEFKSNGIAFLDFLEYALQNNFPEYLKTKDASCLSDEFFQKLGELINYSEQAVNLKKLIMAQKLADVLGSRTEAYEFIDKLVPNEPLATKYQKQEAQVFLTIYFGHNAYNMYEALVRHPSIAFADVKPLLTAERMSQHYYFGEMLNNPVVAKAFYKQLASYDTAPLNSCSFSYYLDAMRSLWLTLHEENTYYDYSFSATDNTLQALVDTLGDDFFKSDNIDGSTVKKLLKQALKEAKKHPGVRGSVQIKAAYNGETPVVFFPQTESGSLIGSIVDGSTTGMIVDSPIVWLK